MAGLVFVILYAGLTAYQAYETHKAVEAAQEANRIQLESTRARLVLTTTQLMPVKVGEPVKIDLRLGNLGHSPAYIAPVYGTDTLIQLPPGDTPNPVGTGGTSFLGEGDHLNTRTGTPRAITEDDLRVIPSLRDVIDASGNFRPRVPVMYFWGRYPYQTLGQNHEVDFCFFLVRNDPSKLSDNVPTKNDEFILVLCPKWNTSN